MTAIEIEAELKRPIRQDEGCVVGTGSGTVSYNLYEGDEDLPVIVKEDTLCTESTLQSMTYIQPGAKANGITAAWLAETLHTACPGEFTEMVRCLRGIAVVRDHDGIRQALETLAPHLREIKMGPTGVLVPPGKPLVPHLEKPKVSPFGKYKDALEYALLHDLSDFCGGEIGRLWFMGQIVFLFEKDIEDAAWEAAAGSSFQDEYTDAVGTTLIHEMRHLMLQCNPLIPEESWEAEELNREENVEAFAAARWYSIRNKVPKIKAPQQGGRNI